MPWPTEIDEEDIETTKPALSYDTWVLNDLDFSWLVESDGNPPFDWHNDELKIILVYVTHISHSRLMNAEIWITSDGRAYLVGLEGISRATSNERPSQDHDQDTLVSGIAFLISFRGS